MCSHVMPPPPNCLAMARGGHLFVSCVDSHVVISICPSVPCLPAHPSAICASFASAPPTRACHALHSLLAMSQCMSAVNWPHLLPACPLACLPACRPVCLPQPWQLSLFLHAPGVCPLWVCCMNVFVMTSAGTTVIHLKSQLLRLAASTGGDSWPVKWHSACWGRASAGWCRFCGHLLREDAWQINKVRWQSMQAGRQAGWHAGWIQAGRQLPEG